MNPREVPGLSFAKKAALTIAGAAALVAPVLIGVANAPALLAQSSSGVPDPEWQAAAGGRMAFDVASVKLMKSGSRSRAPNFALNEGNSFTNESGESPRGRFSATFRVPTYISFAYKLPLTPDQQRAMLARLPKWVDTDAFDIEAKAASNTTKDQMRLMMQSLLAERFHLAVHYETQEAPVYALTLSKAGTRGPKLIRHTDGPPCDVSGRQPPASGLSDPGADVFPHRCESEQSVLGKNGRLVQGARITTMAVLVAFLARTAGRPVVDRTGITEKIDYRLEWTLDPNSPGLRTQNVPGIEFEPDPNPVTFMDAVREQLGLKLQSAKAPMQTLVIDRIERPSEN